MKFGHAISEKKIFENYGYIHVHIPGWEQTSTWGPFFQNHKRFFQCYHSVMIYINFVELLSLMLHAEFQKHRPSGSGEKYFKAFCYL